MQLRIALRPSRILLGLRRLQCLLAALALWLSGLPSELALGCMAVTAVLALPDRGCLPHALLLSGEHLSLEWEEGSIPMHLARECRCHPWCIVLHCQPQTGVDSGSFCARHTTLVLLPDSADPDALRQLRVLLRWHNLA